MNRNAESLKRMPESKAYTAKDEPAICNDRTIGSRALGLAFGCRFMTIIYLCLGRKLLIPYFAHFLVFLALNPWLATLATAQGSSAESPYYAIKAPADTRQSLTLGSVTVTTFSPVTITPAENSTNLYFVVKNQGSQPLTLDFLSWDQIQATKPEWLFHFFKFFGYVGVLGDDGAATSTLLSAGETKTLEFYTSKDLAGGLPKDATLPFTFKVQETGQQGTLNVTIIGDDDIMRLRRTQTASIAGRVVSADNLPVANALVSVSAFNENLEQHALTDADGKFQFGVLSVDDLKTIMGPRSFPYASVDYFITAEADGYTLTYQGGLAPRTGETLTENLSLQRRTAPASYKLAGELATDGKLAYWWIRFAGNGERIVSVQGQHPPVDPSTPGHIIAVDLNGRELWRVPTGQQCWGLDVSSDGNLIAAGCHDGYAYVVDLAGALLYKVQLGFSEVTDVRFSPDGRYLLGDGISSGVKGLTIMNARTGTVVWDSSALTPGQVPQGAYKGRWSADSKRVVAGHTGPIAMFTDSGQLIWRNNIGVSPLWLEVDAAYNSYAAGKNRELFSWDKDGQLRWRYRLAHTSNEAWPGISADASVMVMPTFNGLLQALNGSGQVLWQRFLPALPNISPQGIAEERIFGTGHNALSMSPDGNLVAVGSRGWQALLYDRNGTQLFSHTAVMRSDFQGPDPVTHGNYVGTTAISLSPDGKYIAAGYADSVIRIFVRQDSINASAGWNLVGNSVSSPMPVASAFGDASKVASVWKWVTQGNSAGVSYPTWAFYTPGQRDGGQAYASSRGYEFLSTINAGEGFWVNAKTRLSIPLPNGRAVATAAFQDRGPGWHLLSTGDTKTPGAFNADFAVTTLWTWDSALSQWYFYAPSLQTQGGNALSDYISAKGYLDFASANKTLGPGVGFWANKP